MTDEFWDPEIETMTAADLRRLEAERLVGQVAYVYRASAFYREVLDRAGIDPAGVTSHEVLAAVPLTEKADLADGQRQGELIGPHQAAEAKDIVRVVATGGTTSRPFRLAWTRDDIDDYSEMGARALWTLGCRPDDLVVNCFNYRLYAGGVMDHMSFERLGATVLPYGVGESRALLDLLAELGPGLSLYATPSYAVRLADVAAAAGIAPAALGVAKGFFSGEAGLRLPGYRARIEETWRLAAGDLYGLAEVGAQSGECRRRAGFHYGGGGLVLAELIDPASGDVKRMADDETGELVFTPLRRRASPVLRLRSHDIVRVFTAPCACGRTGFRFETLGRSDDMVVVKGVNVFPLAVQQTLTEMRPRLTGEFQLVLDRPPPIDYPPRLRAEVAADVPPAAHDDLIAEIGDLISRRHGFSTSVELVAAGSIPSTHKTRRVVRDDAAADTAQGGDDGDQT